MLKAFTLTLPFALFAAACTYDNGDRPYLSNQPSFCSDAVDSTIDTGREIEVDAGQGAGVYVEYAAGGHWHVRTSCDVEKKHADGESNPPDCIWDLLLTPEAGHTLRRFDTDELGREDSLASFDDGTSVGTFELRTDTASEVDGIRFDSAPGAAISVDAYLDDTCMPSFFFWVGDGALHSGAKSNPLNLYPSSN